MKANLLLVGLTGGIATGKSVVAGIFEQKGCHIFPADLVARDLIAPGLPAWKKILSRFGTIVLRPDGSIDRPKLAGIVFADPEGRKFLESAIHPQVLKEQEKRIRDESGKRESGIFITEAALIFEAGLETLYDRIIVVHCRRAIQLQRIKVRYGISSRQAALRIRSQIPQRIKKRLADYVIDTSGSLPETIEQAEKVYAGLVQDLEIKLKSRFRRC